MDIFSQSEQLRQALTPFIQKIVDERTRECLRTYKAKVITAPNDLTGKCDVQLVGQSEILSLPYSTAVSDVSVEEMVWVATTYNSWRNAVVWERIRFNKEKESEDSITTTTYSINGEMYYGKTSNNGSTNIEGETTYAYEGSVTLPQGAFNVRNTSIDVTLPPDFLSKTISYNDTDKVLSWFVYTNQGNQKVTVKISYTYDLMETKKSSI